MNSFQSLLNSYNKLRRRTYTLNSINSLLEIVGAPDTNAAKPGGQLDMDKEVLKKIRAQFNSIGDYVPYASDLIAGFRGPQQPPPDDQKLPNEMGVWLAKPPAKAYNFRVKATSAGHTGSLPTGLKDQIIKYLENAEKGGASHTSVDNEAAAGTLTDVNGNLLDPEAMARAQKVAAKNTEIAIAYAKIEATGMLPRPDIADVHSLQGPTQIYPPGHPFEKTRLILARLCEALFGMPFPSAERIAAATEQLQDDTIELLDWFGKNQQILDKALKEKGCIPEDDTMKKFRNRFYFADTTGSNFALGYGNFQGQDEDPCEMSAIMNDASDNEFENFPDKDKKAGYKTAMKTSKTDSGTVPLSTTTGSTESGAKKGSNPLHQLCSKYQHVKICNADGSNSTESLIKTDHAESAGNLVSAVSENSTVLASHLLTAKHLRSQGKHEEAEVLENAIAEVVNTLIAACKKYEDGVKELSKHVTRFEKFNKGTMNAKPIALQAVQDGKESNFGQVGKAFGEGNDKCREVTLGILERELSDNPIHEAVLAMHNDESSEFKGNVTVSTQHPDGLRNVNQITGVQGPNQGVYNVDYPTRCVADTLLVCDEAEDMAYMLKKLGIHPKSEIGKLAMTPQNGKYILPISDKYYRLDGSTNQGVAKVEHLANADFVDNSLRESTAELPKGETKDELLGLAKKSVKAYNHNVKEAAAQIKDPDLLKDVVNPEGAQLNIQNEVEQATLGGWLDSTIELGNPGSKSVREAHAIKRALKELEADRGSPTYDSKVMALADRIAECKEQRIIDLEAYRDKPDKAKIGRIEAGRHMRLAVSLVGSGPGVVNVKHSETGGSTVVTNQDIRNSATAHAIALLKGDTDAIELLELGSQTKPGTRVRKSKSGKVYKYQSGSITAGKVKYWRKDIKKFLKDNR